MNEPREVRAWIEQAGAPIVPVQGSCSIGRATNNQLVLRDDKVSRKHAVIHRQGENEYWLVDLGSSNGTYLNGRRVAQPVPLSDGAAIQIGSALMKFCQKATDTALSGELADRTLMDIRSANCWLLLADIEGSTELGRAVTAEQLPVITGRWFSNCKQVIEGNGGSINKYLGDGFFAYWPAGEADRGPLLKALTELKQLQAAAQPPFRIVLHCGQVFMGGAPSMGEESLSGPEVNFIFRMEKLAASLQRRCLMSAASREILGTHLPAEPEGEHAVAGFVGTFEFFAF